MRAIASAFAGENSSTHDEYGSRVGAPPKSEIVETIALEGPQRDLYDSLRLTMSRFGPHRERRQRSIRRLGVGRADRIALDRACSDHAIVPVFCPTCQIAALAPPVPVSAGVSIQVVEPVAVAYCAWGCFRAFGEES
ncbi:hypothetical protein EAS56_31420 [Bradyrhizobium guangzhouense]|uniref:Uncharacterized protein n=1 Tax=Bradyrhizobium guangzhouense TaxID=1325095 RepID=A0AAE5X288_9BRAD|nr:hypothetical protein XH91_20645 [Bradyrhizobium guangzhouense]RXH07778.1 hypothetical protein EAS56_31420 [Bradyrhizobium guangzhouense]